MEIRGFLSSLVFPVCVFQVAPKKQQSCIKSSGSSFVTPGLILESEENARNSALARRAALVQSHGIVKLVSHIAAKSRRYYCPVLVIQQGGGQHPSEAQPSCATTTGQYL